MSKHDKKRLREIMAIRHLRMFMKSEFYLCGRLTTKGCILSQGKDIEGICPYNLKKNHICPYEAMGINAMELAERTSKGRD